MASAQVRTPPTSGKISTSNSLHGDLLYVVLLLTHSLAFRVDDLWGMIVYGRPKYMT